MPGQEMQPVDHSKEYATKEDIKELAKMVMRNDYRLQHTQQKVEELHQVKLIVEHLREDMKELMGIWLPVKNGGIAAKWLFTGLKWLLGLAIMISALYAALRGQ
jgi:hypothetical protein